MNKYKKASETSFSIQVENKFLPTATSWVSMLGTEGGQSIPFYNCQLVPSTCFSYMLQDSYLK